MKIKSNPFVLLFIFFFISGCSGEPKNKTPELLCYCGATMILPMREIAARFEKDEQCRIKFIIDGSNNLYKILTINQKGDLYLPGCESYMEKVKQEGLITDTVTVGYNQATLVVAKNNPLAISPDLNNLTNKKLRVVLGSPESGAIGRESKRLLEKAGIYRKVLANLSYLTTDSKDLITAIGEGHADLTINWHATVHWPENSGSMDDIHLDDELALKHKLVLGGLSFSRHPELVQRFLQQITSKEEQAIWGRYGFQTGNDVDSGDEK